MFKNIASPLLVILFFVFRSSHAQSIDNNVKRVLFLGNSITWAGNYVHDIEAYLRVKFPGRQWEFINAGLSSETVSGLSEAGHAGGSFPRPDLHERLGRVLGQVKPDLVFACYGMNDGIYMPFDNDRFSKFKEGINWLHDMITRRGIRLVHMTPPYYDELKGKSIGYAAVLDRYTGWLLEMQKTMQWEVVDIYNPMKKYLQAHRNVDAQFRLDGFALASDGIHPGEVGHWIIAKELLSYLGFGEVRDKTGIIAALDGTDNREQFIRLVAQRQNLLRDAWLTATRHSRPGLPVGLPLAEAQKRSEQLMKAIDSLLTAATTLANGADTVNRSHWKGFNRTDFVLQGRKCLVVEPSTAAKGRPWIWRMEFFGHEPQGDSGLVANGYHLVYMDLQDMYGAPTALDLMDQLYGQLVSKWKLSAKTVLEGFSRGGLFAFNWAARHPQQVACLYVDAPVCDFKSWPGGKGRSPGSRADWEKLKKVYGFTSDREALEYKGNPVDQLAPLAKARIPILAVCGETDTLVPMSENILIVEKRYKRAGGKIKLIIKPNNGHHPHSLKDPAPIVEFITQAVAES